MPDKNNTLAATREAPLKLQTSQIKNIPQRNSNAVIEGSWDGLKAGLADEKMAESLKGLSRQPWQQEPMERPKRKHKSHDQPQRRRVRETLDQIVIPPELSNKELVLFLRERLEKLETVSDRTILRAVGRSK
jgi:hypothetical protein